MNNFVDLITFYLVNNLGMLKHTNFRFIRPSCMCINSVGGQHFDIRFIVSCRWRNETKHYVKFFFIYLVFHKHSSIPNLKKNNFYLSQIRNIFSEIYSFSRILSYFRMLSHMLKLFSQIFFCIFKFKINLIWNLIPRPQLMQKVFFCCHLSIQFNFFSSFSCIYFLLYFVCWVVSLTVYVFFE